MAHNIYVGISHPYVSIVLNINSPIVRSVAIVLLALGFLIAVKILQPEEALGSDEQIIEDGATYDGVAFNSLENYVISTYEAPTIDFNFRDLPTDASIVSVPQDFGPDGSPTIYAGQCVNWVVYTANTPSRGNASEWARYIDSYVPEPGAIVVIRSSNGVWHVGITNKAEGDRVLVRSRNWKGIWIVSDDWFEINDPRIVGYIKHY